MWDIRPWCLPCDCCSGPLLASGTLGEDGIEVEDVKEKVMTCQGTVVPTMGPLSVMVWKKDWGVLEVEDVKEKDMTCWGTVVPNMGPLSVMVWKKDWGVLEVEERFSRDTIEIRTVLDESGVEEEM